MSSFAKFHDLLTRETQHRTVRPTAEDQIELLRSARSQMPDSTSEERVTAALQTVDAVQRRAARRRAAVLQLQSERDALERQTYSALVANPAVAQRHMSIGPECDPLQVTGTELVRLLALAREAADVWLVDQLKRMGLLGEEA